MLVRTRRSAITIALLALLVPLWRVAPAAASPVWNLQASMAVARAEATTTVLDSGKVLVTGGMGESYAYIDPDLGFTTDEVEFASAELYDPATRRWTMAHPMSVPRTLH